MSLVKTGDFERDSGAERRRWAICAAVVIILHVAPAIIVALWPMRVTAIAAPPPAALMVDMAPLPVPPAPAPPRESPPPDPQQQRVLTPTPSQPVKKLKLPRVVTAAVPLLPGADTPAQPHDEAVMHNTTAAPTAVSPAPAAPPEPTASAAPSNAVPTWQGLVLGRLEQFKRYPAQALARRQQGVTYLRFTIDRDGNVLSATIEKSAGSDLLDSETLTLIQRAQPLPKPPPDVQGDRIELVAPIEFFLKNRR